MSIRLRTNDPVRHRRSAARSARDEITRRQDALTADAPVTLARMIRHRDLLRGLLRTDRAIAADVTARVLHDALAAPPGTVTASVADGVVILLGRVARRSLTYTDDDTMLTPSRPTVGMALPRPP